MTLRFVPTGALMVALLSAPLGTSAADAPWQIHQDQTCGIELKYPASYGLEASGAREYCALWIRVGVREARGLRALFSLAIREMESADRVEAAKTGTPPSARDFALHVATNQCTADGSDGSTYCTNGEVRSTFKTAQGFRGFEIPLTEVHERAARTRIWLLRIHESAVATKTITRIRADLGLRPLQRPTPRRPPRPLTLFEKPNPGAASTSWGAPTSLAGFQVSTEASRKKRSVAASTISVPSWKMRPSRSTR